MSTVIESLEIVLGYTKVESGRAVPVKTVEAHSLVAATGIIDRMILTILSWGLMIPVVLGRPMTSR